MRGLPCGILMGLGAGITIGASQRSLSAGIIVGAAVAIIFIVVMRRDPKDKDNSG